MNIEISHILIDATLKSLVILGLPSLALLAMQHRWLSANERFTILSASISTLLVLTITSFVIQWTGVGESFLAPTVFELEMSDSALSSIQTVWFAIALPLVLLTSLKFALAEWQCITRTTRRLGPHELPENLTLKCPVILDEDCIIPCVKGILFRRIFVPVQFFEWSTDDMRNILLHEHFHINRRDILWKCISDFAVSIFWFNPLIYYVRSRIGLEQEISCDNGVLTSGVDGAQYSETILLVAKGQKGRMALATSISMSGRSRTPCSPTQKTMFPLLQRIQAWQDMLQLRSRVLSIIDPQVCRRSLGLFAHTLLFFGVSLLSGIVFCVPQLQAETNVTTTVLLQQKIIASDDDAEENVETGTLSLDSRDLELCVDTGLERNQLIGLRFADLPIPQGAEILTARIVFTPDKSLPATLPVTNVKLDIFVQQSSDPHPFRRSKKDISRRIEGNPDSIYWEIDQSWLSGQASHISTTPELRSLVQERMGKDWKPSDALVFVIKARSFDSTRSAASFDNVKQLSPPKLRIVYTISANQR